MVNVKDQPNQDHHVFTPTGDRRNEVNEEAALAHTPGQDEDDYVDVNDALYNGLDDRLSKFPNHDWSVGFKTSEMTALKDFADSYYRSRTQILNNHTDTSSSKRPPLIDPELFKPENAKSDDQKFLIYHHLYHQYRLLDYIHKRSPTAKRPAQQTVLVEGLPGVGKSFITNTLRNITRLLHGAETDAATAPTGVAANIINGSTHYRYNSIPTGREFRRAPTNSKDVNCRQYRAKRLALLRCISRFMDEHSMAGRPMWGWLKHKHEEFRRPTTIVDTDGYNVHVSGSDNLELDSETYSRMWGGLHFIYSFGDSHQLPPVGMKPMYSSEVATPETSDFAGRVAWSEFFNPPENDETENTVVVMEDVIRQDSTQQHFKDALAHMREGNMEKRDVDLLISRCLFKLPEEERKQFEDGALHLVQGLFILQDETEGTVAESSLPTKNALCVGVRVMLLHNFLVEHGLMNGAVGYVRAIRYEHKDGPNHETDNGLQNAYYVVEFPDSSLPDSLVEGFDSKHVPIPFLTQRCEKKCCSVTALPLRVCRALTIHKSQGMTVGREVVEVDGVTRNKHPFQNVIVYMRRKDSKHKTPGSELVAFSRVTKLEYLAIGNSCDTIDCTMLYNIGKSNAYDKRRNFLSSLKQKALTTQQLTKHNISLLDTDEVKTYEGGCKFLLDCDPVPTVRPWAGVKTHLWTDDVSLHDIAEVVAAAVIGVPTFQNFQPSGPNLAVVEMLAKMLSWSVSSMPPLE
ncbi:hypothetical protein THAOC_18129 [Thalassiosira oceanica]|uniref:ATP-dependent DNA helicase n=1 Tax=Thalassiosira oceanica TaxID=159749 RepID=K0S7Y4_THAOC|nr:hypothetical protein THAOC_18129 [Thalassiosira oceanica]|eukprot:EJK61395.1 hypothetical protein THAOC_18129 [Thalassiosira oceanica]